MSTKIAKNKLQKKQEEINKAQEEMNELRQKIKETIAQFADETGLVDIDISDADLKKEFKEIVKKYTDK